MFFVYYEPNRLSILFILVYTDVDKFTGLLVNLLFFVRVNNPCDFFLTNLL